MNTNYIPDKEINLDKNDLLGVKPYTETLSEIISNSQTQLPLFLTF